MRLRKIIVFAVCAVSAVSLAGCGEKEQSSEETYYGQAYKEVDADDIYRIYDGRYVTDEEADAAASYLYAIQNKDSELFKSTQPDFYIDYLEKNEENYVENYLEEEYNGEAESLGGDFEYTQIEITDCGESGTDHSLDDITEMMDGICEEEGIEKPFSETIKDKKYIEYTLTAVLKESDGAEYSSQGEIMYIITCEDGIYVF